jgi:hypothetical protein
MSRHFAPSPKDCLEFILHTIIASSFYGQLILTSKGTLGSLKKKTSPSLQLRKLKCKHPLMEVKTLAPSVAVLAKHFNF